MSGTRVRFARSPLVAILLPALAACTPSAKQKEFEVRLETARNFYDEGDLARAVSMSRQALQLKPDDTLALAILGMSLARVGASSPDANAVMTALNEAITAFEKCEQNGAEDQFQVQSGHGAARAQRARMFLIRAERSEQVAASATGPNADQIVAIYLKPEEVTKEIERLRASAKTDRAAATSDLAIAEDRLLKAIAQKPKDLFALEMLQTMFALKEDFDSSAKWGEEAMTVLGGDRAAWVNLAKRPNLAPEKVDQIRDQLRDLQRREKNGRSLLALAHEKLGNYDAVVLDLGRVLTLDPDRIEDYFNRGVARKKLKDYAGAVLDFETFLRRSTLPTDSPRVRETWENIRECRASLGQPTTAAGR